MAKSYSMEQPSFTEAIPLAIEDTPKCYLLGLPAELQNEIYELSYTPGSEPVDLDEAREKRPSPALLTTCKEIYSAAKSFYDEAKGSYWSTTEFVLRQYFDEINSEVDLHASELGKIEFLTLVDDVNDLVTFRYDRGIWTGTTRSDEDVTSRVTSTESRNDTMFGACLAGCAQTFKVIEDKLKEMGMKYEFKRLAVSFPDFGLYHLDRALSTKEKEDLLLLIGGKGGNVGVLSTILDKHRHICAKVSEAYDDIEREEQQHKQRMKDYRDFRYLMGQYGRR